MNTTAKFEMMPSISNFIEDIINETIDKKRKQIKKEVISEIEDFCLGIAIEKGRTGEYVKESEILEKIKRKIKSR